MTDKGEIGEVVLIEWDDTFASNRLWEDKDGLEPLPYARCTTVGFLIEEEPESLTVVGTTSEYQVLGRLTIPKRAITRRRTWPENPTAAK